jgi:Spy/CpxP family protein refolding chaperone
MPANRITVFLSLLLVFSSGAVLGALGHRYYSLKSVSASPSPPARSSPEEFRKRYMATMSERLKLNEDQKAKLGLILDDTRQRYNEFWEKYGPERKAIEDNQFQQINAILTPEQQTEYAAMRREREERRKAAWEQEKKPAPTSPSR